LKEKNESKSCIFGSVLNRDFPKLTSLSFSLRPSVLRHVMYTIVDRYVNERETWSKSTLVEELDAATCRASLRKVVAGSTFSAIHNAIFRVLHEAMLQLSMQRRCVKAMVQYMRQLVQYCN
jgi:hypothetical protein